jgi:hypothetical protein
MSRFNDSHNDASVELQSSAAAQRFRRIGTIELASIPHGFKGGATRWLGDAPDATPF